MRLKLFALFLAIQGLSFGVWNGFFSESLSVPVSADQPQSRVYPTHPASSSQNFSAPAQKTVQIPRISRQNMSPEERMIHALRVQQIAQTFAQLPTGHIQSVKSILLDYNPEVHRGLGGNFMIILRAIGVTNEEFVGVLIHELAHNVDYGYLTHHKTNRKSPFKDGELTLYETDPSLEFYRFSWLKTDRMRTSATSLDFVSGYAMTDPFEDFAETYTYYVLHNRDFKALAATSPVLLAKYNFMKEKVFEGQEFDMADGWLENTEKRPWDTTVLPYDLKSFNS